MAIAITWFQSSLNFCTTVTQAKGVYTYTHTTNNTCLFGSIIWLLRKAQPSILMPRDTGHAPFSGKMMHSVVSDSLWPHGLLEEMPQRLMKYSQTWKRVNGNEFFDGHTKYIISL